MLRAVQEISDYSSNDAASRFPNRAGSFRTDLKNPALEFIKAVCRVVSLDGTVSDEVLGRGSGDLEVEPAPASISTYAENGGTPVPPEDVIERRMKIESLMNEIDEAAADVAAAEEKAEKRKKKKKK